MFKKLITLSLAFIAIFTLTACGKDEPNEDLQLLEDAKSVLILQQGIVESDITLPTTGANGVTITWSSDKPAVITNAGVVTRPAAGEGNETVVMTATLTKGDESITKDITLLVAQMPEVNAYTSVATLHTDSSVGDNVSFQGKVSGLYADGYMVSDGTNSLNIYNPGRTFEPAIGDTVLVSGGYAKYKTAYQISDVISQEVVTVGDGTNPMTAVASTVAAVQALDSTDPLVHSRIFTVTGTITIKNNFDGYASTFIVDGDAELMLYYKSLGTSLDALAAAEGSKVTLDLIYYTEDVGDGEVYVVFDGGAADLHAAVLSPRERFDTDVAAAENAVETLAIADVVLPSQGVNSTLFTEWSSSNTDIFLDDGTFVARGLVTTDVTFTGTATLGSMTQEITIDVQVPVNMNVGEALDAPKYDALEVTGIVYMEMYYGFYMYTGTDYIFVYGSDYNDDLDLGDEITILGYKGEYKGTMQISGVISYLEVSTGNDLPDAIVGTVAGAVNDVYPRGTMFTITGTVTATVDGSNTYYSLVGPSGLEYDIYKRSSGIDFVAAQAGNIVTIEVISYQDYMGLYMGDADGVVVVTAYTEADNAQDAIDSIDLGDVDAIVGSITLPSTVEAITGSAITWVSDTHATMLDDGTVIVPFGNDAYTTLTATLVLGGTTLTREFHITVLDGDLGTPLDVTTALAEIDGETVVVTGIVTGFDYNGKPVIQDTDGTSIFLNEDLSDDVAIGDLIVVRGELTTYDGNSNDTRQLGSVTYLSTTSSDNAVFIVTDAVPATVGVLATIGDYVSQTYTMTLEYAGADGSYTTFVGDGTTVFKFYTSSIAPYMADVYTVGDTLEITFLLSRVSWDDLVMEQVVMPALTDAQNMIVAQTMIDVALNVTSDVDLETALEDYNATIVWTSTDETVIALDGTVVRPAIGENNAEVTLVATITVGALTETETFVVTVPAIVPIVPSLIISEVIEGGGYDKAIELYNATDTAIDLSTVTVEIYNNGSETFTKTVTLTGSLAPGEVFVINHSSADAVEILANSDLVNSDVTNFNGDDEIKLLVDGVVVDVMTSFDDDTTHVRNSDIVSGNTIYDASEWTKNAKDDCSDIGTHTVD